MAKPPTLGILLVERPIFFMNLGERFGAELTKAARARCIIPDENDPLLPWYDKPMVKWSENDA